MSFGPHVMRVGGVAVLGDDEAGAAGIASSSAHSTRESPQRNTIRSLLGDLLDDALAVAVDAQRRVLVGLELDLVGQPALELGRLGDQLPGALAVGTGRTTSRFTTGIGGSCN